MNRALEVGRVERLRLWGRRWVDRARRVLGRSTCAACGVDTYRGALYCGGCGEAYAAVRSHLDAQAKRLSA